MKQLDLNGSTTCTHEKTTFCTCMVVGCRDEICCGCGKRLGNDELKIIYRRKTAYVSGMRYLP